MADPRDLAVDLHDLWFTATASRDMRDAHLDAAGALSGCNPQYALMRPDTIGLGSTGFLADWVALRDQVADVLRTNATSLGDTADALDLCIADYTSTDAAVRDAFEARKAAIPYE